MVPLLQLLQHIEARDASDDVQSQNLTMYLAQKDVQDILPGLTAGPSQLPQACHSTFLEVIYDLLWRFSFKKLLTLMFKEESFALMPQSNNAVH